MTYFDPVASSGLTRANYLKTVFPKLCFSDLWCSRGRRGLQYGVLNELNLNLQGRFTTINFFSERRIEIYLGYAENFHTF